MNGHYGVGGGIGIAAGVSRSRCVAELRLLPSTWHGVCQEYVSYPWGSLLEVVHASICFVERVQDRYALHFNTWRRVYRL